MIFSHATRRRAFTLVELLVVIAIISIVAAFSLGSFENIQRGRAMTASASHLIDYLALGRQTAMTLNQPVRVWFCPGTMNDSVMLYRTEVTVTGTVTKPADKELKLHGAVILSDNNTWSSVLSDGISGAKQPDPKNGAACYSFRFMPDGSTDLAGSNPATVTLIYRTDNQSSSLPPNFFSLQIDQQTGAVRSFRPQ